MRARSVAVVCSVALQGCLGGPIFGSAGDGGDTDTDTDGGGNDSWNPSTGTETGGETAGKLDVGDDTPGGPKLDVGDPPTYPGQLHVLLGQGDGTFVSEGIEEIGNQPTSLAAADIDGDGTAEILVGSRGTHGVTVGRYVPDAPLQIATHGSAAALELLTTDLNQDGITDVVAFGWYRREIHLLFANGAGGFLAHGEVVPMPTEQTLPARGEAADLNADGHPDLVVLGTGLDECYSENLVEVVVFLREPGAGFTALVHPVGLGLGRGQLAVADMDGDLVPDVIAGADGQELYFLRGLGGGALDAAQVIPDVPDRRFGLVLREDAVPDLILATFLDGAGGGAIQRFPGVGDGGFGAPDTELLSFYVRDLYRDGADHVLAAGTDWVVRIDPTPLQTVWQMQVPGEWSQLALGDVDGDGNDDLLLLDGEVVFASAGDSGPRHCPPPPG